MQERILKFRAWHKPTQKMFPVDGFTDNIVWEFVKFENDKVYMPLNSRFDRKDCVMMQFTGIHDKSGKEIYEGDIIVSYMEDTAYDKPGNPKVMVPIYNEVVIQEGSVGFLSEHDRESFAFHCEGDISDAEVVGNVFENPDLVKDDADDHDQDEEVLGKWDSKNYEHIPDVPPISNTDGLTNWLDYQATFIQMQHADRFLEESIKNTEWVFIKSEYFDQGISAKSAFQDMFYE